VQCSLPQGASEALALVCTLDEEVKKVGTVSDSDEAGKLRTSVRKDVPPAPDGSSVSSL